MGLKTYEIITVGSDRRVRALRSWQVGDRYVNIGDMGGIVYDEKTLSQDGACWLFRGNFGFPGARIGGDSIVDVGEATLSATGANALVRMEGNAKFTGSVDVASTNLSFIMRDNAVIEGKANTRSGVVMSGNSKVTATGQIMAASRGVLVMEENASIEANTTVIGAITLSGNYKGNAVKTWTGKRTITDVNEPEYDNNVKTQYDF